MTTNELKDAAIFVMAYSFLKMDSSEDLGLFINKKASKFITDLLDVMTPIVKHYYEFQKRIDLQIAALDNKARVCKNDFSTTAPQLACDLLYLKFAPNNRKGQRLAPILAEFYACNKDKIAYILNKSYDTKYSKEAEDSQNLAYFYIENI
ncbi:hypothetical protein [Campylobacter concisus]|uniref:Uncharacterized protein n=1 Tax=Campylobacter concisus TaxID=199 RepID=A0A1X0U242_9BACT|nr:hypothetical protein [Campylobacter concisus]ORI07436.1 hypothetical protein A3835_07740 [Campylobacter concisus]DAY23116.1 MAG TPA: hypothetical protein [Caudoviricetes sp.]